MIRLCTNIRKLVHTRFYRSKLKTNVKVTNREIHFSSQALVKMFMETENKYAFEIIERSGQVDPFIKFETGKVLSKDEYDELIKKNWLSESKEIIFETFLKLATFSSEHNICISNSQYDNFIDSLTDNVQYATDEELKTLFYTLMIWPETKSIRTRNYVEVWAALDDECLNRYKNWSFDEYLTFINLFYMLNATRASDFCYKSIQKLTYRSHQLTKVQFIQTMFYIATIRSSLTDMHNLEIVLENNIDKLTIDELAVISMGFFKSQVPIRNMTLISKIIDKIIPNSKSVHELSLAALLKVIRLSRKLPVDDKICTLLDTFQHEVPRLSVMCNVHLALLATSTLTFHENCLQSIANQFIDNVSLTRLKDMERLVLTFGTFALIPKTKSNFAEVVIHELRKPIREEEIKNHGRSFACCVAYLGLLNYFPVDLMKRVLNKEFLQSAYGKHCLSYGREVLTLHNQMKFFYNDLNWECLTDKEALALAKKYTDYLPDENYKKQYNVTEKMHIDVKKVLEQCRGGQQFVAGHHILTHHQRGDLIICDNLEGSPVPVSQFNEMKFGKLCYAPKDNNIWIALIIAGRNAMLYNIDKATGQFDLKSKELNALGFYSAIVLWRSYQKCQTYAEKSKYLNQIIDEAKLKARSGEK